MIQSENNTNSKCTGTTRKNRRLEEKNYTYVRVYEHMPSSYTNTNEKH